ncbi:unnamed protein product [Symbiodinium natans]|uniref:Uncharacterized protein n=1 Tax=Symbiodinium natans TaxID=878477 RepID=A0A812LHP9_9DINO|nr:unnamed protein product [Symbiodinium natans]
MAFVAQFAEIEDKSCPLLSCCCWGLSCTSCDDPCCLDKHKCCCCSGGCTSGEDCVGQKGCMTGFSKTCCCVQSGSLNNMAVGCCDIFVLGRPYGEGRLVEDPETAFMQQVCWCFYCLCIGWGCGPSSPFCFNDSKCLCIEEKDTTDEWWTHEGMCHSNSKAVCLVTRSNFPPSRRIGCGACGRSAVIGLSLYPYEWWA